jgi:aryl-alcohol dehydrogenase-like predicted oxidoreductase
LTRISLAQGGPKISPVGLGCFAMSGAYGTVAPRQPMQTIRRAVELGCNFLDTADIYGGGEVERTVGSAIRGFRNDVVLASKFGLVCDASGAVTGRDASPGYVRQAIESSLRRLNTDTIDLYYLHRIDPAVPVEDTVGAMAELVHQGKVRYLGLSEASAVQIRRAHAVHPITAVQSEYSLWSRDVEREILPVCHELGVGFVAFAPLGRGLLSGAFDVEQLRDGDFRRSLPRFQQDALAQSLEAVQRLKQMARERGCIPAQLALSWILHQGNDVAAIPGTTRIGHLEENLGACDLKLTEHELEWLDWTFPLQEISSPRYAQDSPFAPD